MFRRALLPMSIAIILLMVASFVLPGFSFPSLVPADADSVEQPNSGVAERVEAPDGSGGVAQSDPTDPPSEEPGDPPADDPTEPPAEGEPTEAPAEPTDEPVTEEPPAEGEPTEAPAEPTDEPVTEEPPAESTPAPTDPPATEEPTPAPTESPAPTEEPDEDGIVDPEGETNQQGAACQFSIDNAGDNNPFTFDFTVNTAETFGIEGYEWDFGDVVSPLNTNQDVEPHTFPGVIGTTVYTVTLTCIDTDPPPNPGDPPSANDIVLQGTVVTIYQPSASFFISPTSAIAPATAQVSNLSFNIDPVTYTWTVTDLGDDGVPGGSGPDADTDVTGAVVSNPGGFEPTFNFANAGVYQVVLQTEDGFGNVRTSSAATVTVAPPPPLVTMTVAPGSVNITNPVTVTVTNDANAGEATTLTFSYSDNPDTNTGEPTTLAPGASANFDISYTAVPGGGNSANVTVTLDYNNSSGGGQVQRSFTVSNPATGVTAAFREVSRTNIGGGQIEICLENTSTGPWDVADWDFAAGSTPPTLNDTSQTSIVCYQRASGGGSHSVTLDVEDSANGISSQVTLSVSNAAPPVAVIDLPPTVVWGDNLNGISSSNSTGTIELYEWDLDGDGTFETSNTTGANQSINNVQGELGVRTVRLRVSNEIRSAEEDITYTSTAEATFLVVPREITTCDIQGVFAEVEGTSQNYTVNVPGGQLDGRTIDSYAWQVNGPGSPTTSGATTNTFNIDWASAAPGTYTIDLIVSVDIDGSGSSTELITCSDTQQVEVDLPLPTCQLVAVTPGAFNPVPDGSTYTYEAQITGGLAGRTITNYTFRHDINIDNVTGGPTPTVTDIDQGTTSTLDLTFSDNAGVDPDGTRDRLQALITLSDGSTCLTDNSGSGSTADIINIDWEEMSCTFSGNTNPIPTMPDQTRSYTYTISWTGDNDLDLDPTSTLVLRDNNGVIQAQATAGDIDNANNTIEFTFNSWDFNNDGQNWTVEWDLQTTASPFTDDDGGDFNRLTDCSGSRTINVDVPNPTCRNITGDLFPVIGEEVTYQFLGVQTAGSGSAGTHFGRTPAITYEFIEDTDGDGDFSDETPASTGSVDNFTFTFNDPDTEYRLRFTAAFTDPDQSCNRTIFINTPVDAGEDFTCDFWDNSGGNGGDINDFTPNNDTSAYDFAVNVDNTNGFALDYTLIVENDPQGPRTIRTSTNNTTDGVIAFNDILGSEFGPIDNYAIRIEVRPSAGETGTTYTCDFTSAQPDGPPATGIAVGGLLEVGDFTAQFTDDDPGDNRVEAGTSICLDNNTNSTFSAPPGSIDTGLVYEWDLGAGFFTPGDPTATQCITTNITDDGVSYPAQLRVSTQSDVRVDTASRNFIVFGQQSISLDAFGGPFFDGDTITFTTTFDNIDDFEWVLTGPVNESTGFIPEGSGGDEYTTPGLDPGTYTITVTGRGDLGSSADVTATANFTVNPANSIGASFTQSGYNGDAPFTVCFYDTSFSSPDPITSWTWDFDVDDPTNPLLTYNTFQAEVCHVFDDVPGRYNVSLTVDNGTNSQEARSFVRLNNAIESSVTFRIEPGGGTCAASEFEFIPIQIDGSPLTPTDFRVIGWNFDSTDQQTLDNEVVDLSGAPTDASICYGFTAAGVAVPDTYIVCMDIRDTAEPNINDDPDGIVCRPVTVAGSPPPAPSFDASASCTAGPVGTFTVTNTSANPMTTPDRVTITDGGGQVVVQRDDFLLGANGTPTDSVTYNFTATAAGPVTLNLLDNNFTTVSSVSCPAPPDIQITDTCEGALNTPRFQITNVGGPLNATQEAQTWQITDPGGTVVDSGTYADLPVDFTATDPYGMYTLSGNGPFGTVSVMRQCNSVPVINVSSTCVYDGPGGNADGIQVTIENTGGDMVAPESFEIQPAGGGTPLDLSSVVDPAQYELNGGDSLVFVIPNTNDPYADYSFQDAGDGFLNVGGDLGGCDDPVINVIASTCGVDPITFIVSNSGGAMITAQDFEIRDGSGTALTPGTDYTPSVSTFQLDAGTFAIESITFTLDSSFNSTNAFSFVADGVAGFIPAIDVENGCAPAVLDIQEPACDTVPLEFVITNTGADMLAAETVSLSPAAPFSFENPTGGAVTSGNDITLPANASITVRLDAAADPYTAYTLDITNNLVEGETSATVDCADPDVSVAVTQCDDATVAFTVTNDGAAGDMLVAQDFTIAQGGTPLTTSDYTPGDSTFTLAAGASVTYTVTNADPYAAYEFDADGVNGFITALNETRDCADPDVSVTVTQCDNATVAFTVTNDGGAGNMLLPQPFTISQGGTPLTTGAYTPGDSTFELAAGASVTYTVTDADPYAAYEFDADGAAGFIAALNETRDCDDPVISVTVTQCSDATVAFEVINARAAGDMLLPQDFTITENGTPLVPADYSPSDTEFQLNGASSVTYTVTDADPYATYVFMFDGVAGFITPDMAERDCDDPLLLVEPVCGSGDPLSSEPLFFTITNDGSGPMLSPETIGVTADGSGDTISFTLSGDGLVADPAQFQLEVDETLTVTLDNTIDPYIAYTLAITGGTSPIGPDSVFTIDCDDPNLVIESTCAETLTFTITNNGAAEMLEAETVEVLDPDNNAVSIRLEDPSGTALPGADFQLGTNTGVDDFVTVILTDTEDGAATPINPYLAYTLNISSTDGGAGGFAPGDDTLTIDCADPNIVIEPNCGDETLTFTISNTVADAPMLEIDTVTVTDTNGDPVNFRLDGSVAGAVVGNDGIRIPGGESVTVTLTDTEGNPDTIDPYARYNLSIDGNDFTPFDADNSDDDNDNTSFIDCDDVTLNVENFCEDPLRFTITNTATGPEANMLEVGTVVVTTGGVDITTLSAQPIVATGDNLATFPQIRIPAGGTLTLQLPADLSLYAEYTLAINDADNANTIEYTPITGDTSIDCEDPALVLTDVCGSNPARFMVENQGGAILRSATVTVNAGAATFTIADDDNPANSTLELGAGGMATIAMTGLDPYAAYTVVIDVDGSTINETVVDVTDDIDCEDPDLQVSVVCDYGGGALVFNILNNGGLMVLPTTINISGLDASAFGPNDVTIAAGATQAITVPVTGDFNPYVSYTISSSGGFVSLSGDLDIECEDPVPQLQLDCQSGPDTAPGFTVTNNGGTTFLPLTVSSDTGSFSPALGDITLEAGASQTYALSDGQDPYAAYTISVTAQYLATVSQTLDCEDPVLSVSGECVFDRTFTVTNTGGLMLEEQSYEIRDQNGTAVQAGTFDIDSNQTFTLSGLDPYVPYTFFSSGFAGGLDFTLDCPDPDIVVTSECVFPIVFTVTNNGPGPMLLPQGFSITDANGGGVAYSPGATTFELAAGQSTTFTLEGLDPYAPYTFNTSGFAGDFTLTNDCEDPFLTIASQCAFPVSFTLRNVGALMLTPQSFSITDENGNGVPFTPVITEYNLGSGEQIIFLLNGLDPYAVYTFSSSGFAGNLSLTNDCEDPTIVVENTCGPQAEVLITNIGPGNMLTAQAFSITDELGVLVPTIPTAQEYLLGINQTETFAINTENPYAEYSFLTEGFAAALSFEVDCEDPEFVVESSCDIPLTFTVTNVGGDMYTTSDITIEDEVGTVLNPTPDSIELLAGLSEDIVVEDALPASEYTFTIDGAEGTFTETVTCDPTQIARAGGTFTIEDLPTFTDETVTSCGFTCPTFHVYHTDETGEWEIFRLDGADPVNRVTARENLTRGNGTNINGEPIDDIAPSRSPNAEWIAFSSNRDGNWEIYITPTNGNTTLQQRVTYNEFAIDTDPVWGPHNYIVYESTRNGNWDLYVVDVETGIEFQLTSDDADDINPFWSPDGSKVIFQSNRDDGVWQIYELDLVTRQLTLLSDGSGTDVDPQYNNAGDRIVFRSYRDGADSVLYLMDADGSNPVAITDVDEDATNAAWSPTDELIAFQSNQDGDLDIYVYEVATGERRQLTDNTIPDYAPTWICDATEVIFTSDIEGNPDIFSADATPISDPAILVEEDADQLTFEEFQDVYPQDTPAEENASREGRTSIGDFGVQTVFIEPEVETTEVDPTFAGLDVEEWTTVESCEP